MDTQATDHYSRSEFYSDDLHIPSAIELVSRWRNFINLILWTMNLENQVVSLELAKKLKELGVKQEGYFVWYTNGDSAHLLDTPGEMRPMEGKTYSAFTVAEMGEMFPRDLYYRFGALFDGDHYLGCFADSDCEEIIHRVTVASTEADARAEMLIYLLENKLFEA